MNASKAASSNTISSCRVGRPRLPPRMKRTTISLPDDLAAALEREARRRRVPVSQVAREAIEARLGWNDATPPDIPFIGIVQSEEPHNFGAESEDWLRQQLVEGIHRDATGRDR